ncbi:LysR family transcriptional regulator [Konateibacter massiliensis]|uniref:LysR family transcriptional regulator n=1 Tax=Konateibacter massiliensis TaxID=2002841 RepID=UPI000C15DEAB|nr:LysR family transcriptional regulator [Konateibacter massiliensis]
MMDFRMNTFITVCRCMNFTKAAEQLNITQPAVTQHIHYLEAFYGAKLFAYEGKRMYLTKAGDVLYQATVTMKHDEIYLKESIRDLNKREKRLLFGATLTIGEFVIAEHLKTYLDVYPDMEIKMTVGNTSELLDKLCLGEIDFALVEGNFTNKEYDCMVYSQERYIPVCGKDYFFKREPEQLMDLLSERIMIREKGSGTREILEKNLQARNLCVEDFRHVVEIGGMNAIKLLVESGCGITFLYEAAVRKELENGIIKEIKLKDFHMIHDFKFIWNKGSVFSDNYREICNLLKGESL